MRWREMAAKVRMPALGLLSVREGLESEGQGVQLLAVQVRGRDEGGRPRRSLRCQHYKSVHQVRHTDSCQDSAGSAR